jgi:hypothetical protein
VGPCELEHSGIVGVLMWSNQDRHLLTLMSKCGGKQAADGACSKDSMFHGAVSPLDQRATSALGAASSTDEVS